MNKKIFFLIVFLVLITGCSSLEFAYNAFNNNIIKEKTLLSISGNDKDIINSYLLNKIGEAERNPTYVLTIFSQKSIDAIVTEVDATVSKFMIKHNLKYVLNSVNNNCIIFEETILTKNLYDAKSAGYSFGTDIAEKEMIAKNLHLNIDQFLNELSINYNYLKCKNED